MRPMFSISRALTVRATPTNGFQGIPGASEIAPAGRAPVGSIRPMAALVSRGSTGSTVYAVSPSAFITPIVMAMVAAVAMFAMVAPGIARAASAENGKAAYVKNGCWQCHGFVGQGGPAGPKLAPDPMPLATLSAFIRNTNGRMPPYMEAVLSNADLADIHAYLLSIPKPADYKSIPLLR